MAVSNKSWQETGQSVTHNFGVCRAVNCPDKGEVTLSPLHPKKAITKTALADVRRKTKE